jgi:hypothetical protein
MQIENLNQNRSMQPRFENRGTKDTFKGELNVQVFNHHSICIPMELQ